MGKKRKKTPEERAAERAYSEDLDRRILDKIARLEASIAENRAAEGRS